MGNIAVEDVLLAHELFHVTEYRKKDSIFTQTEKVELWRKPFSNRSRGLPQQSNRTPMPSFSSSRLINFLVVFG